MMSSDSNVPAKGNRKATTQSSPSAGEIKAALAALAKAQNDALASSTWVGRNFVSEARAMHEGEISHAPIHGEASLAEAKALIEDGVPVAPLPFPVTPPNARN